MQNDILKILISEEELAARIGELARDIERDYKERLAPGDSLLMISILKGSVCFMADLMRAVRLPAMIDFMAVSSYGKGSVTTGAVRILKDLDTPVEGRHLLIVEDILDSGKTLSYIMGLLETKKPASIRLCTLLDKPLRRQVPVAADYTGFEVPDEFVVGYGLDYAERYRNLPYIGILKPEIYA